MITRHYLTIGGRRVHYRRCGRGPALLMVHQSPRSSAEFEALMQAWGAYFTCIAPDTPGFGQSDPLMSDEHQRELDIDDFADAIADFADALGCGPMPAYGFHSGGILLITALRRRPQAFTALAIGGYAVWTPAERSAFSAHYLPPFVPSAYGEHLTWLWHRLLEQSWFFPWFDVRDATRLPVAHADIDRVHAAVMDMLDAGDAYRAGYGAVLRAPRDIPAPEAMTAPVLISAYTGDPLQAHIDRLGPLPAGWSAQKVASPAAHQALSLAFLKDHAGAAVPTLREDDGQGFLPVQTERFAGLIHWRCRGDDDGLIVHGPGEELDPDHPGWAIDLPGHGLSDPWPGAVPTDFIDWQAVVEAAARHLGAVRIHWPRRPIGEPAALFPDLTPDRFGSHLARAFAIARARALFTPWYAADAAHAIDVDQRRLTPEALHRASRALLRATGARGWAEALQSLGEEEKDYVHS